MPAATSTQDRRPIVARVSQATIVAALGAAIAISGCGGSQDTAAAPASTATTAPSTTTQAPVTAAPATKPAVGRASAKLAASRRGAGTVIDGDIERTLASLKGVPVVVKQWASWCPQCRHEFPFFQELADRYRDRVAFVGLNARDDRGDAESFSAEASLKFPSIFDADGSQSAAIGAGRSWPTTVIFDAEGNRAVVKPGAFATIDELDQYIRRFALSS